MSTDFAPPPDIPAELLQTHARPEQGSEPLTVDTGVSAQMHQTHDAVADLNLGVQANSIELSPQAQEPFTPSLVVGQEQTATHQEVLSTLSSTDAR